MKHLRLSVITASVILLLLTGCKKEMTPDNRTFPEKAVTNTGATLIQKENLRKQLRDRFARLPALPADGFQNILSKARAHLDPQYRNMVSNTINAEAPVCNDNTPLNLWLDEQLSDWDSEIISYVLNTAMLDLPFYDAYFFENSSANQSFGTKGQYTHTITKTFKNIKRFWDIQSDNMITVPMHGSMLRDRAKLIRDYNILFGLSYADAVFYADFVLDILDYFPQLRNGSHPIFTFNAVSSSSFYFPPVGQIPNKIIMGDGILDAYAAIGFGDVAPQAIFAHEYGHQVQFQLNVFGSEQSAEATRRTELMADAFSSYYLHHARGESMQWKRVKQYLQVFYNIGDCSLNSSGHHGTPNQRMAAAEWAYHLARDAQKQGHILPARTFVALFDAQLPILLTK